MPNGRPFHFCDQPHAEYAHVVLAGINGTLDLWSVEGIRSICRLDEILRSTEDFPTVCQTADGLAASSSSPCCPSWSIGHYVALMTNRTGGCDEIVEEDVETAMGVLASCAKHYHGLQLSANCDSIFQEGKRRS